MKWHSIGNLKIGNINYCRLISCQSRLIQFQIRIEIGFNQLPLQNNCFCKCNSNHNQYYAVKYSDNEKCQAMGLEQTQFLHSPQSYTYMNGATKSCQIESILGHLMHGRKRSPNINHILNDIYKFCLYINKWFLSSKDSKFGQSLSIDIMNTHRSFLMVDCSGSIVINIHIYVIQWYFRSFSIICGGVMNM